MKNNHERLMEKTYNRMWPSLCGALGQCSHQQKHAVLAAGMRSYAGRISRGIRLSDAEIDAFISLNCL